ncbi:MAG: exodeoxyribonuclease VII large subunit [Phycisphaerae bacterium]|nr:exodeoxyribonuclease VII large subunit [Phycisphaerae bacterium]
MASQRPGPLMIYTVSQVNALIKAAIEDGLPQRLTVRGEIRDWRHHHSGHCYFMLKDQEAVLSAVMWAGQFRAVRFEPQDGMAVLATGYVDLYVQGGKVQLYVERLEPEGKGALHLAFEQMVAKLKAEGLFDEPHKRPVPRYPERIGILTSQSGAAVHDICESIHGRWPPVRLFLYPVPVQGEGAAGQIAAAIHWINAHNKRLRLDLLIVGRGGGSLEDLWAFNEEVLARAIYASAIPILSAVGHEVDVTVADLVADARASTPAKAGVVAVPDQAEVLDDIHHYQRRLSAHVRSRVDLGRAHLRTLEASDLFRRPLSLVRDRGQWVDEMAGDMADRVRRSVQRARAVVDQLQGLVQGIEPHRLLGRRAVQVNDLAARHTAAWVALVARTRMELESQANRLEGLNPKAVLGRGYSLTTARSTGRLVRTSADVEIGDVLVTELAQENLIESQVTRKYIDGV